MSKGCLIKFLRQIKPYVAVIMLQFGFAGAVIISKSALDQGMSHYIFSVYRNVFAALAFAPFALAFERKTRPRMTFAVFYKIIILGLLEPVLDQNLFYAGMQYTSASFASAMCNIVPAVTFLLAWILRLERVNVKQFHSQAKITGTLVTVGGAMIMTLVKGPIIGLPWNKQEGNTQSTSAANTNQNSIKGDLMIIAGCFCWAIFYNLQAITLKSYPAGLSLTSLICGAGALQGAVLTFVVDRGNPAVWNIHWDSKLLAYVYGGIVGSGVAYYVSGVIMKEKGPVFVTSFNPLGMVIVAVMGSFILAEQLQLGKVVGAVVIVIGLYLVLLGKSKDRNSFELSSEEGSPIHPEISATNSCNKGANDVPQTISSDTVV